MRTTKELIEDLKAEALALKLDGTDPLAGVQLVVGFEATSEFIYHHDPEALAKLNEMIQRGGEPIGLISIIKTGKGHCGVQNKLLPEYAGQEWAQKYLNHLTTQIGVELQKATDKRKGGT